MPLSLKEKNRNRVPMQGGPSANAVNPQVVVDNYLTPVWVDDIIMSVVPTLMSTARGSKVLKVLLILSLLHGSSIDT